MSEQNKATMKRWFEVFNQGRDAALAILDETVTPDYVMHDPSGDLHGREALRQFLGMLFDGMPDLRMTLDDMITEGERLAYRFAFGGTHQGELMGFPPTGRQVQVSVTSIARFVEGKMAEETQTWDFHGFLEQLSSTEANKALARRWFDEVLNQRNLAAAEEICAEDMLFHAWHWPELRGPAGVKQFVTAAESMCPDFQYSIEDLIAEGDKVDVRWTFKGTQVGEVMGIAPTGKVVTTPGTTALRMAAGKIVEHWGYWDALGMVQQLSSSEAKTVQVPVQVKAESAG